MCLMAAKASPKQTWSRLACSVSAEAVRAVVERKAIAIAVRVSREELSVEEKPMLWRMDATARRMCVMEKECVALAVMDVLRGSVRMALTGGRSCLWLRC